jgi:hypothetical protein
LSPGPAALFRNSCCRRCIVSIVVPDFSDSELVFDDDETKLVLKFFYPASGAAIDNMTLNTEARRFAQTLLIGAIDASYGIGYIQALGKTVVRPGSGVRSLAKKLAKRFVAHWFKHATQEDLLEVKIYDSVRNSIAGSVRTRFNLILAEQVSRFRTRGGLHMYITIDQTYHHVWV